MTNKQHIYCLYGSQTGNSEQAAEDFCRQLPEKYTAEFFAKHKLSPVDIETTCMQLDDFLELKDAKYSGKAILIFVSSYGVGQAPLGAYRFRSFADKLVEGGHPTLFQGMSYAICGLGDSTYPTYLQNPTTIDEGLTKAGATRIVPLGKADAHQIGNKAQDKVIAQWMEDLWVPLAKALADTTKNPDHEEMQKTTLAILQVLDPDFKKASGGVPPVLYVVGLLVAILAVLIGSGMLKLQ